MVGWRTISAVIIVIVLGALQAAQAVDWVTLVGPTTAGAIVSAIGIAFGILRFLTTTPIGGAKP